MKHLIIQIQEPKPGSPVLVNLIGKLCGMDAVHLRTRILQLMEGTQEDLVLNLSDLNAIDLKGVNSLAAIYKLQDGKGCRAAFIHQPGSRIMSAIQPTKLDRVLPFQYASVPLAS